MARTTRNEWPVGGATCWFMEEPPPEMATERVGDRMVMRVRQQSAVPAGLVHIVREHPESELAAEIRALVRDGLPESAPEPDTEGMDPIGAVVGGTLGSISRAVDAETVRRVRAAMGMTDRSHDHEGW